MQVETLQEGEFLFKRGQKDEWGGCENRCECSTQPRGQPFEHGAVSSAVAENKCTLD